MCPPTRRGPAAGGQFGETVITQLQSGGLDASYIGPSPAITAYAADPSVSIIFTKRIRERRGLTGEA